MARKDTINALIRRGIEEKTAETLTDTYNTLKDIGDASIQDITALGISEEDAKAVLDSIGKRPSRSSAPAKAKKEEEVKPREPMEIQRNIHIHSAEEERLLAICERIGADLTLKTIIEIAGRIEDANLDDETVEKIMAAADRMYKERRMDPNESVGMMAAHSIGEPGTQMNMRTFHHAGVANINVTLGLPRLIEIVDARRVPSTPSMNIPLLGEAAEDEGIARRIAFEIETTVLENVATLNADSTNMEIKVELNNNALSARGLTKEEIADRLNKVRILRGLVDIREFDLLIRCDVPSFKRLQTIYEAAKAAKIKGIDGVSRAVLARDEKTGKWYIVTEGSNLKEVLKVPGVYAEKTMTNSILEIGEVLGIEAARNSIMQEAKGTLGEAGLNVDVRHIMLVSDLMTNDGSVKAIGRHGISGRKSSVLARAAFEITAPHLLRAAMNGEVDNLEGVAENIIVGQPVTLGTGAVNLVYSPKKKKGDKK